MKLKQLFKKQREEKKAHIKWLKFVDAAAPSAGSRKVCIIICC